MNPAYVAPLLTPNPRAEDWKHFLRVFKNYCKLAKITDDDDQLCMLENHLGRDGIAIFDGLPAPKNTFDEAVARFNEYFQAGQSVLLHRKNFNSTRQAPSESISQFACRLRRMVELCQYPSTFVSDQCRDIFVAGVANDRLGERLLSEDLKKLTFDIAVNKAEIAERAFKDRSQVAVRVSAVQSTKPTFRKNRHTTGPAGKVGHFAKVCRSEKSVRRVDEDDYANSTESDTDTDQHEHTSYVEAFNDTIYTVYNINTTGTIDVQLDGVRTACVPDTGAAVNVIPGHMTKPPFLTTTERLKTYGGNPLQVLGTKQIKTCYKGVKCNLRFLVVEAPNEKPLLCTKACRQLGILQELQCMNVTPTHPILSQFPDIFKGLGCIKGVQCRVYVKPTAVPRNYPPRRLPPALLQPIKEQIQDMERQGVIKKVEDIDWCAPIVPVRKKNGTVRICVDFRLLNEAIVRQPYQMPSLEDIITRLGGAKIFSSLDARSGYYQIRIEEESQKYLGFTTPIGRFKFMRLPFGISSAPEMYQKVMNHILQGLQGVVVYLDDVLVFGATMEEHDKRLKMVLKRVEESGIKLNGEKCVFGVSELQFLGHNLSEKGIQPTKQKQTALSQFPTPTTKKQVRSFLGLAEYAAHRFIPKYSDTTSVIWDTIKTEKFVWTEEADAAFNLLRKRLAEIKPLSFFDDKEPVIITTDASGIGLGAVLQQQDRPVMFISRRLSDCETRYSQIEREFLAIVFALYRFKSFALGRTVTIHTDNKPLISFFKKDIDKLPLRIQRWMLALQPFSFQMKHIPGKENDIADALSRSPVEDNTAVEVEFSAETVCMILQDCPVTKEELVHATTMDEDLIVVKDAVLSSNWSKSCKSLQPYYPSRHDFSIDDDGLLLFRDRIIVPYVLRKKIMMQAHEGHLGAGKMMDILRSYVYWPKMTQDVENFTKECEPCIRTSKPNIHAPMTAVADAVTEPWHTIAVDFTGGSQRMQGKIYFSIMDYYSRYPSLYEVRTCSSEEVIRCLKHLFSQVGFPTTIITDNGTAFVSEEFVSFLERAGVKQRRSSPYYPQSNGVVERFHGTLKSRVDRMLLDGTNLNDAIQQSMFNIRNTPNQSTGKTPFAMFYNRHMPTRWRNISEAAVTSTRRNLEEAYQRKNERRGNKMLEFEAGESVLIRRGTREPFDLPATVLHMKGYGAWLVEHPNGRKQVVNQRFMKKCPNKFKDCQEDYDYFENYQAIEVNAPQEEVPAGHRRPRQQPPQRIYPLRRRPVDPNIYR
jgi:transposase InsO family protein